MTRNVGLARLRNQSQPVRDPLRLLDTRHADAALTAGAKDHREEQGGGRETSMKAPKDQWSGGRHW
jgi:hypothetical protein